ncbi:MAG TPA: S8 family serine peptidase [bacterium]
MHALVFIAILAVLPPVPGKLTPDLLPVLENAQLNEKIVVIVNMDTEYPYANLEGMNPQEKCGVFKQVADNSQKDIVAYIRSLPANKAEMGGQFWIFNGFHVKATKDVVQELARRDDVWFICSNAVVKLDFIPGEETLNSRVAEWNIAKICADSCWLAGYDGTGVIVGHIDTGVLTTHAALTGKWLSPYWVDGVAFQGTPYDDHGHGTHTMGTICGGDGYGTFTDDVGVAYGAQFIPTKAFDAGGSGTNAAIDTCMQYLANLKAGGIDIRVIGNSWGNSNGSELYFWTKVLNWKALGVLPVFSNGNSGPGSGTVGAPGSYPLTIGVGSTNSGDAVSNFSSRGPAPDIDPINNPTYWYYSTWNLLKPDVSAPGENVRSSLNTGGYGAMSGTSMASPHVTGGTAVLLQKNMNLTVQDLYDLFYQNCDQPSGYTYPNYDYGWGRINLWRSLQAVPTSNRPNLILSRNQVVNDNNANGKLDPGEYAGIVCYIRNTGSQPATSVQSTLRTASSYITITDSLYTYGAVNSGDSANNASDPFDVTVAAATPPGTVVNFSLVLAAAETTWVRGFSLMVGTAPGQIIWGPKLTPVSNTERFIYGAAYDRVGDRLYVCDGYGRQIFVFSSDSFVTSYGTITQPDTCCSDITYSRYDDRLYVTGWYLKQVYKINKTTGAVLRQFTSPCPDYPVGLALCPTNTMWYIDRRVALGALGYFFIGDTLGNVNSYDAPIFANYNNRCIAYDSLGNTFVQVQTWFNSGGTALDSVGVVEYANTEPPTLTGRRFLLNPGWNPRGIEFDPRDGNYWITIPEITAGTPHENEIVKVKGFYVPALEVEEQVKDPGRSQVLLAIAPNPAAADVVFQVNPRSVADLKIFDVAGRIVNRINLNAGSQNIRWNRRDATNMKVADGVYFVRVETEEGSSTQKLVLTH